MSTIMLSGGFDPLHVGHVRMIRAAAEYGAVMIALNSDDWLRAKKGYAFMTWEQRCEILSAIRGVVGVVPVDDSDGSVCQAIELVRPDAFGNGGDRIYSNTPEKKLCERLGVQLVWGLGGGKVESSSELVEKVQDENRDA